jgi:hypothetical protein
MNASRKVPQLTPRGTRHPPCTSTDNHGTHAFVGCSRIQVDKYLSYLAAVDVGGSKGRTRGLEKRGLPSRCPTTSFYCSPCVTRSVSVEMLWHTSCFSPLAIRAVKSGGSLACTIPCELLVQEVLTSVPRGGFLPLLEPCRPRLW